MKKPIVTAAILCVFQCLPFNVYANEAHDLLEAFMKSLVAGERLRSR